MALYSPALLIDSALPHSRHSPARLGRVFRRIHRAFHNSARAHLSSTRAFLPRTCRRQLRRLQPTVPRRRLSPSPTKRMALATPLSRRVTTLLTLLPPTPRARKARSRCAVGGRARGFLGEAGCVCRFGWGGAVPLSARAGDTGKA